MESIRPVTTTTCAIAIASMMVSAFAELVPVSPKNGGQVQLLSDLQKGVLRLETMSERIDFFRAERVKGTDLGNEKAWRQSLPLVLMVKATGNEAGPWKVRIGKMSDLSDARVWYVSKAKINIATGRVVGDGNTAEVVSLTISNANLEIGTRYYWSVECRGRCRFDCHPKHGCEACQKCAESQISTFVTEPDAPRWIGLSGNVKNIRDLGGRIGLGGRRIRQGLIFRGQGLNDNSVTGETAGSSRLTVEDVRYLTKTLGIRTDLDLRGIWETADMVVSPLGEDVRFVLHPSAWYKGIFENDGMRTMADNFRVFCKRSNYPVYFHCIGGADRTGALAYVLNCVLGVCRREVETDWESTFYPSIPDEHPNPEYWCRASHLNDGFSKYGNEHSSWNDRVILYLKDCGITDDEIAVFRSIMFE